MRVLEAAGFRVQMPPVPLCCGLTWISTGQLAIAERGSRRTVEALPPRLRAGVPVIGLEAERYRGVPLRCPELLASDPDVERLALAELL